MIIKRQHCSEFQAQDKALVRELVSPRNSPVKNLSIAEVRILPGESCLEHHHESSEEVYYILAGRGQMVLEDETEEVIAGDTIIILPGQRHQISNPGDEDLVLLAVCSPAYTDEDQVFL